MQECKNRGVKWWDTGGCHRSRHPPDEPLAVLPHARHRLDASAAQVGDVNVLPNFFTPAADVSTLRVRHKRMVEAEVAVQLVPCLVLVVPEFVSEWGRKEGWRRRDSGGLRTKSKRYTWSLPEKQQQQQTKRETAT